MITVTASKLHSVDAIWGLNTYQCYCTGLVEVPYNIVKDCRGNNVCHVLRFLQPSLYAKASTPLNIKYSQYTIL